MLATVLAVAYAGVGIWIARRVANKLYTKHLGPPGPPPDLEDWLLLSTAGLLAWACWPLVVTWWAAKFIAPFLQPVFVPQAREDYGAGWTRRRRVELLDSLNELHSCLEDDEALAGIVLFQIRQLENELYP